MVILTGKNLGERHRELNLKIIEAVDTKTDFKDKISGADRSYIDILFKIDVASKYRKLDYIMDMLKSGDDLFITRALKCTWMYDDEYSNVINPTYLHHNIFPYMSQKMKRKMLTTISMHVRNEDRVVCFYSYCVNAKLLNLSFKFLIYTPEEFKMDFITNDDYFDDSFEDAKYIKQFIGTSIALADAYVDIHYENYRPNVVHELRFLYFMFEEEYLNILEKYLSVDAGCPNSIKRFGIRISRAILKKHKSRVWEFPLLYVNKLNKSMLVKYLTSEDVKQLSTLLLPTTCSCYWSIDFYHSYKFILNSIPFIEIFEHLKKIFTQKYDGESFEMNLQFYNLKYYNMYTAEEQESWALLHIERDEELFGSGNDYIWYKFVRFEKAFEEIKKYIFITSDHDTRNEIVKTLVDCSKNQEDLMKLLNYYYERHVNESEEHKMNFLDQVISKHDIYAFCKECWTPFDKLLYSLEAYTTHNTKNKFKEYVMRSMIYHILNNEEFSDDLQNFIEWERRYYIHEDTILALSIERINIVMKYWLNFHAEQLRLLLEKPHDDRVQDDIHDRVCLIWDIIWCYRRDEKECPDVVLTYMKSNLDYYQNHPVIREKFVAMTEEDFVRLLKSGTTELAIESISKIMCNAYRWSFRLNRLLRKLRVYFTTDVAEEYLQYFSDSLDWLNDYGRQYRNIKLAVVGVFQLGNYETKNALLKKYAPVNRKINYGRIDNYLLQVQKAICRLSYHSRPPIELSNILKYVTGDYVRFCLPMFNHYSTNLPMNMAIEFIYKIIDSPVSIQKHGLRLAFNCFQSQDLVQVVLKIWKRTKNVSLRLLLYKTLYMKMVNEHCDSQNVLYDVLKICTLDLNHEDHEDIFDLLVSDDMPEEFRGVFIETAWKAVNKFSNKKINLRRKTSVICHMKENIYSMEREFLRDQIIDEHIRTVLYENRLIVRNSSDEIENFRKAKWDLTATYIVAANNTSELEESRKLMKDILVKCFQIWSHEYKGVYTTREFCSNFLNSIHDESCMSMVRYMNVKCIYQCILDVLRNSLTKEELYLPTWKFKLSVNSRKVLYDHYNRHEKCLQYKYPCAVEIAEAFAKEVRRLLQELTKRKEFYSSLTLQMVNALKNVCGTMGRLMGSSGFQILVCGYLMQTKLKEAHVFAVMLIPKDPPKYWEKRHENVVKTIKQCNNEEIKIHYYNKFVSDGKVRKII